VGVHLEAAFVRDALGNGNAAETYTFVCGPRAADAAAFYGASPSPPYLSTATSVEEVVTLVLNFTAGIGAGSGLVTFEPASEVEAIQTRPASAFSILDQYAYLLVDFLNPGETYAVKFDGAAFTSADSGSPIPETTATSFQVAPRIAVKHTGVRADIRGPVLADSANDLVVIGGDGVSSVSRSSTFRARRAERGDGPFPICDGCVSATKSKDHLLWRSADPPGFRLLFDGEKRSNLGYKLVPEVETIPCTCPVCIDGPYNWSMPEFGEKLDYFKLYEHTSGFDTKIDWICQVGPDWGMEETQGYYALTRDVTPPLLCTRQQEYFSYWVTNRDACIPKPCYGFPPMPYHPVPDVAETLGPHNCSIASTRTVAGDPTPFWFEHDEMCTNECSPGYLAPDPRTIKCDRGIYPQPHPTCDPRTCVGLQEPNQGVLPADEAKYMEEIRPICNYGWEPDVGVSTCVALNVTKPEALADFDAELSCKKKTCAPFPDLGSGTSVDCTADDTYLYEQVCSVQCDYGFALEGGMGPNSGTFSCTHDSGVPLVGWGPPDGYLCEPLKCDGFDDAMALIANSGASTCYEGMGIDETCVVSCAPGYSIFGETDRRGDDVPAECIDVNGLGTISEVLRASKIPQTCEMLSCPTKYTPTEPSKGFTLSNTSTSSGNCDRSEAMGGGNICAFECRNGKNSNDAAFLTCIGGTYYGCPEGSPGCDVLIAAPICLDDSKNYEELLVVQAIAEFSLSTQSLNRMVNKASESSQALKNGFAAALDVEPSAIKFTSSDPAKIARANGRRLSDGDAALLVLNFEITVDSPDSNSTLALIDKVRAINAQKANATAAFLAVVNAAFEAAGLSVTVDGVMISEPMLVTVMREIVTPSPTPEPTAAPLPAPVVPPPETSYFWLYVLLGVVFLGGAGAGGYTVYQRQKTAVTKSSDERQQEREARSADDI
jgi:hypothetical protein